MTDSIELGNLNTSKSKLKIQPKRNVALIKPVGNLNKNATTSKNKSKSFFKRKSMKFEIQNIEKDETNSKLINKKIFDNVNLSQNKSSNFKSSRLFDKSSTDVKEIKSITMESKNEELFSKVNFFDLKFHDHLVSCLKQRFNISEATKVQALSIPPLLEHKDALIKSATGSGKTFAYSIPMIHSLQSLEPKIDRTQGLYALIILPTRELALQTYDCLNKLLQPFRRIVLGLMIGGEKKKSEKARIRKGLNILVTTPGRLLDHLIHTQNLKLNKLQWLVIDEADRLYEQGFSAIISQIVEYIKNSCTDIQTVLLSATLSKGVKELAGLSLRNPTIIDVGDSEQKLETITLPTSLENSYLIVPPKLRLVTLCCILVHFLHTKNSHNVSKIIVFMSCQDVVDFYSILLNETLQKIVEVKKEMKILQLRGNMNQTDRTQVFKTFHDAKCGILFCTDVASRGLDLPNVDLVVQMNIPAQVEDYVHRVGRTARVGSKGLSILVMLPSESEFINYLQEQVSINFSAIKMDDYFNCVKELNLNEDSNTNTVQERLAYIQQLFEMAVYDDEKLHNLATKAYLSHLRSYASYPHKMARYLPFRQLHLGHIAKSFALRESPKELGAKFHNKRFKSKIQDISSMKRKMLPLEERVTEFGGGVIDCRKKIKK